MSHKILKCGAENEQLPAMLIYETICRKNCQIMNMFLFIPRM